MYACNCDHSIGDEYHCLLECAQFKNSGRKLLRSIPSRRSNVLLFKSIMTIGTNNFDKYRTFCLFFKEIAVRLANDM